MASLSNAHLDHLHHKVFDMITRIRAITLMYLKLDVHAKKKKDLQSIKGLTMCRELTRKDIPEFMNEAHYLEVLENILKNGMYMFSIDYKPCIAKITKEENVPYNAVTADVIKLFYWSQNAYMWGLNNNTAVDKYDEMLGRVTLLGMRLGTYIHRDFVARYYGKDDASIYLFQLRSVLRANLAIFPSEQMYWKMVNKYRIFFTTNEEENLSYVAELQEIINFNDESRQTSFDLLNLYFHKAFINGINCMYEE